MSSTSNTTIAFFGATGGCAGSCLTHTLQAGYHVVALARTPSKLIAQLQTQGISQSTLDTHLRIVKGDATDPAAVRETILLSPSTTNNNTKEPPRLVSQIISGLGGTPVLTTSYLLPTISIDNPSITESSTKALISALQSIYTDYPSLSSSSQSKPLLTVISTTGLNQPPKPNDVPLLMRPLYHLLAVPHADKAKMEALVTQPPSPDLFRGVVIVKPSLLMGTGDVTSGRGWRNLRVGTEKSPAVGYTIARADVGEWIFEEVIREDGGKWVGERVSLTS